MDAILLSQTFYLQSPPKQAQRANCHLDCCQLPLSPSSASVGCWIPPISCLFTQVWKAGSQLHPSHGCTKSATNPEYFKASKTMIFPGNIPTYLAVLLYFIEERIRKPGIKYARHTNKLFRKAHEKKHTLTEKHRQIQRIYSSHRTFKSQR